MARSVPNWPTVGKRFFDRPWIDATLKPGKAGGAFAHPTVPSAHPYLLLNYHGRTRDVMTLAHELGHGVHQVLAGEQGYLMAGTPLTLAETASVFGEMLTFRALLDAADPKRRRIMLAAKVEDMLNTVVRQIAFYQFETLLHDERRSGELVPDRIGELWMQVQTESLGPAFEFTPEYSVFWAYVPHFIHSPFYVYAYAFGDCLVNALYSVFQVGPSRVPGEVSGHAARRRHQAAQGTAGAVRSGRVGSGVLEEGAGRDLRLHRRAGAGRVMRGGEGAAIELDLPLPLREGVGGRGPSGSTRCSSHARAMRRDANAGGAQALAELAQDHQVSGLKFRRQVPLGRTSRTSTARPRTWSWNWMAYRTSMRLRDAVRDTWMAEQGIRDAALLQLAKYSAISRACWSQSMQAARHAPSPDPLPQGEGECSRVCTSPPPSASMSDRSNLFGEIRRMARTSGAVGGIAARVAGERVFGIKTDRAAHAEDLRTILGGLKGPLMKVAQFLSTVPDALPAEYAAELAQLQANAPPMGWNFVRRRMASELGPDWQSQIRRVRPRSRGRGQPRPGASRHACPTAPRSPASCNIPTCRARWRPICGSCAWPWRSITAWTTRSSTRRSTRN